MCLTRTHWAVLPVCMAAFGCSGVEPGTIPANIAMVLGDHQDATVGQPLSLPLLVQVTDAQGAGVAGASVSWHVTSGDGALDDMWEDCGPYMERGDPFVAESVTTNLGGFASVSFVPAWFGTTTVAAEVDSAAGSPVTFTIDAADSSAEVWVESPFDQQQVVEVIAGPQRALDLVMGLTDGLGDPVPGVPVTWEITLGGGTMDAWTSCEWQESDTAIVVRTDHVFGGSQVSLQPTAFGITMVTASVPWVAGSPVRFTVDATVFEIVLFDDASGNPVLLGPDYSASATVPVGATVEGWNQNDAARITATVAPPGGDPFDSGTLSKGARFQFVPSVAGTWEYVDQVSGVTGTLTAEGQ